MVSKNNLLVKQVGFFLLAMVVAFKVWQLYVNSVSQLGFIGMLFLIIGAIMVPLFLLMAVNFNGILNNPKAKPKSSKFFIVFFVIMILCLLTT